MHQNESCQDCGHPDETNWSHAYDRWLCLACITRRVDFELKATAEGTAGEWQRLDEAFRRLFDELPSIDELPRAEAMIENLPPGTTVEIETADVADGFDPYQHLVPVRRRFVLPEGCWAELRGGPHNGRRLAAGPEFRREIWMPEAPPRIDLIMGMPAGLTMRIAVYRYHHAEPMLMVYTHGENTEA